MTSRTWRRGGLAALTAATLAPAVAGAATADAPRLESFEVSRYAIDLAAAPDGGVWATDWMADHRNEREVVRFASDGRRHAVRLASDAGAFNRTLSGFQALPDGRVGLVVGRSREGRSGEHTYEVALARLGTRSDRPRLSSLPQPSRRGSGFAIAPDGAVWWGRACDDAVYRRAPGGRLARFALRRRGCRGSTYRPPSAMAIGPDGSAWLFDLGQSRVARIDVRGRIREWRTDRWRVDYGAESEPILVPDPRGGGAAFADRGLSGIVGRITPAGRMISLSGSADDGDFAAALAFEPDGTLWRSVPGGLMRMSPKGGRQTHVATPRADVAGLALARDGAPWFTAGVFHWEAGSSGYGGWFDEPVLGVAGPDGVSGSWPFTAAAAGSRGVALRGRDTMQQTDLVLGPDGALWATVVDFTRRGTARMVRATPAGLAAARRPVVRVRRTIARTARGAWLQLACAADAGRFCRGNVRLGAGRRVLFVVAGGQRGTVRVTLARRARRVLRRSGVLRTRAVVRAAGAGTSRSPLTLRRTR